MTWICETVIEIPAGGEPIRVPPQVGNPEVTRRKTTTQQKKNTTQPKKNTTQPKKTQQDPLAKLEKVAVFLCFFLASHLAWDLIKLAFGYVTIMVANIAEYAWLWDVLRTASTLVWSS